MHFCSGNKSDILHLVFICMYMISAREETGSAVEPVYTHSTFICILYFYVWFSTACWILTIANCNCRPSRSGRVCRGVRSCCLEWSPCPMTNSSSSTTPRSGVGPWGRRTCWTKFGPPSTPRVPSASSDPSPTQSSSQRPTPAPSGVPWTQYGSAWSGNLVTPTHDTWHDPRPYIFIYLHTHTFNNCCTNHIMDVNMYIQYTIMDHVSAMCIIM